MLLSIVTVNYNDVIGLTNTVESVLGQDSNEFEYIIIDGGSSDGSAGYILSRSQKFSYWISESDNGIYDAMNKGIAKATGDYIMFLNSGDVLADEKVIGICLAEISCNKSVDVFYGNMIPVNHLDPHYNLHIYPNELKLKFFKNDTINHQASLIKRDLFQEFGYYPNEFRLASDYWLFLQSRVHQKKFYHIGISLVRYDFSGLSSLDGYKSYKLEQLIIWNSLVPDDLKEVIHENEMLNATVKELNRKLSYGILKLASDLNFYFQKFKSFLNIKNYS
jgi:glycosyltransferase involved in cell wall biosynthesis